MIIDESSPRLSEKKENCVCGVRASVRDFGAWYGRGDVCVSRTYSRLNENLRGEKWSDKNLLMNCFHEINKVREWATPRRTARPWHCLRRSRDLCPFIHFRHPYYVHAYGLLFFSKVSFSLSACHRCTFLDRSIVFIFSRTVLIHKTDYITHICL